ncbi:MAG: ABC transporter ATP-binding protein [Clostridia bacterium]|nr:ABC transporter ATP-binding protein [Clostridia bacterium]
MPILELKHIRKEFVSGPRTVTALGDVSLRIEEGEMTAVTGPSGAGKSTLLQIMAGLLKPTSGEVKIDGQDLGAMSRKRSAAFRRKNVGYVFQRFNLLPMLTARENIAVPALLDGVKPSEESLLALAESLGIEDRLDHFPSELSGGEQQRVAIARALVNDPRILFADEPTGNLDSGTTGDVMEVFGELNRAGRTILIVTHDPAVAGACRRVLRICDGEIGGGEVSGQRSEE